jgi:hypothetical protein
VTCVNASPSGRYVLTGSRDGTALVWLAVEWPQNAGAKTAGASVSHELPQQGVASDP